MSQIYWLGSATAVRQVDVFTVTGAVAGDVYQISPKDEYNSALTTNAYTVPASPTDATVATAIAAAWNLYTPNLLIAVATVSSTKVILTATSAGVPQYLTSSVIGTGTFPKSSAGTNGAVANVGPSDLNTAANYSTGIKPAAGDTFTVDGRGASPILYGLAQTGVTLANLFIDLSCSQFVGQAAIPWQVNATNIVIGRAQQGSSGQSNGPTRINLDLGTVQTSISVLNGNSYGADVGQETIRLKGTNASNVIQVAGGWSALQPAFLRTQPTSRW